MAAQCRWPEDVADSVDAPPSPPDATETVDPVADAPPEPIVTLPDAPPVATPCVGGTYAAVDPDTGHCYLFFEDPEPWLQALTICGALSPMAHLVTVTSSEETTFLADSLGLIDWWDGRTDAQAEGTWVWHNGEAMVYTNWRTGEPNNATTLGEDCGVLEGDNLGLWDDRTCTDEYAYVCERD